MRRDAIDRLQYEYGFDVYGRSNPDVPAGGTGFYVTEQRPSINGRMLVVAYERSKDPGRSVAPASADIAGQFAEARRADVSRLPRVEGRGAEWLAAVPEFDQHSSTHDHRWVRPEIADRAGQAD
jgi:hypothetical protein